MEIINLLDLYAKITLDDSEYNEGLDRASGTASSFASKIGSGLATAAKVGAAALSVAAGGIAALTKSSVESYAEYEQLAGGAAKIFNEMSQPSILSDAQNAYKELGISASQYLSVMNDVGATFAATMGDEAGYEAAKTGLQAISDYASGTGKSVDELSQKFTLITRSTTSYQSIADQFSGILPATSKGFLEQAQAVGVLDDSYTELSQVPIAEYQAAVSKMLQEGVTALGLAGNTAAEASTTVSGSLAMMRSAWANLVTGIGDENANLGELVNNFVDSVATVGENLMPRVVKILDGIGQLVVQMAPVIAEAVPQIAEQVLPSLLNAATTLVLALITSLPSIIQPVVDQAPFIISSIVTALMEMLPMIIDMGMQLLVALANGIAESLPTLIPTIIDVVLQIVDTLTDPATLANLTDAYIAIILGLANGLIEALPVLLEKVPEIIANLVEAIVENIPKLTEASFTLMGALATGLIDNISQIIDAGKNIVEGLWDGIKSMASWITDKVTGFFSGIVDGVKGLLGIHSPSTVFADMGKNMALGLGEGWDKSFGQIKSDIEGGMNFEGDYAVNTKTAGASTGGVTFSGLTINISGANYSDENALAEAISYRLQQMVDRKAAVYA